MSAIRARQQLDADGETPKDSSCMHTAPALVSQPAILATIQSFARLDERGDKKAMNKLALRLQKEQPHVLGFAAQTRLAHNDTVGEAAVFYATLIWAMFSHGHVDTLPRVTLANLEAASSEVAAAMTALGDISSKPPYDRTAPAITGRQPALFAKVRELLEEDVREAAMTVETCAAIITPIQVVAEAFDAALTGRRPGEKQGTYVAPVVPGRNDTCHCGSGKKYKRCHGG